MIRNFLYSVSLHLFILVLLYSKSILYKNNNYLNLNTSASISVSDELLNKIKNSKSSNEYLSNLSIDKKIELYERLQKLKSVKITSAKYKEVRKYLMKNKNIVVSDLYNQKNNSISNNKEQTIVNNNQKEISKIPKNNLQTKSQKTLLKNSIITYMLMKKN